MKPSLLLTAVQWSVLLHVAVVSVQQLYEERRRQLSQFSSSNTAEVIVSSSERLNRDWQSRNNLSFFKYFGRLHCHCPIKDQRPQQIPSFESWKKRVISRQDSKSTRQVNLLHKKLFPNNSIDLLYNCQEWRPELVKLKLWTRHRLEVQHRMIQH